MNYVKEYQKTVERSRTQKPIGYIEYKVRPLTANAERAFSEKIAEVVDNKPVSFVKRLLNAFEIEKNKAKLTEENYEKAGFNKQIELHFWEDTQANKQWIKNTILQNTAASLHIVRESEIELTMGEFIPYPPVKEPTFDDIPDLRELRKEVKK